MAFDYMHPPEDFEYLGEWCKAWRDPATLRSAFFAHITGRGRRTGPHPFGRSPAPVGAVLMDGYWWGVLTPFAIILGILLLYLTGNLFGAIVSWAWKKAHYGLLKKGWIAEDYDEDSREWTTRPGAERLAAALTRSGEYRMLPCFGWMILITRDYKEEKHDEKRN